MGSIDLKSCTNDYEVPLPYHWFSGDIMLKLYFNAVLLTKHKCDYAVDTTAALHNMYHQQEHLLYM